MKVKDLKKVLEGIRDDVPVYIKHLGCGENVPANDWMLTDETIFRHKDGWNVFVLDSKDEHQKKENL